ncbi:MAG: hypothetical protein DWQ19_12260 [Crenarchaeota archaeon]|nr:MAG: hypothetical protein DWQ19_12260 [Thermoproteota archaeon]
MYAVIKVNQPDGEYVEGLECIGVYPTEPEAQALIETLKKEASDSYAAKKQYVQDFVDKLPEPPVTIKEWEEYLAQFKWRDSMGNLHQLYLLTTSPMHFKRDLAWTLMTYNLEWEGFDPPKVIRHPILYAVEINLESCQKKH